VWKNVLLLGNYHIFDFPPASNARERKIYSHARKAEKKKTRMKKDRLLLYTKIPFFNVRFFGCCKAALTHIQGLRKIFEEFTIIPSHSVHGNLDQRLMQRNFVKTEKVENSNLWKLLKS
jgi:hypothetical protein